MCKIAVLLDQGQVSQHFGGSSEVVLFEVDRETRTLLGQTRLAMPEHRPGLFPVWLRTQGVECVIVGQMGERARSIFEHARIELVLGAPAADATETVRAWLDGSLELCATPCDHDHHHDHDHEHCHH